MTEKLHISVSPHIHSGRTTTKIMLDVIIALLPVTVAGVIIFGLSALAVLAACIITTVTFEFLFNLITKRKQTIGDLSAIVTGLLLGLNLPANLPIWQAVIGSIFSIIIVKCIFGGIGKNLVNPAIAGRVFMILSFANMTKPGYPASDIIKAGATPLSSSVSEFSFIDLLLGDCPGSIGEVCKIALLIGGIYLIIRKVITWHAPISYIGSVFAFAFLFGGFSFEYALYQILAGGLIIGAFFMATDYTTTPATAKGKLVFGIGAGFITVVIRIWGVYPEGVSYAILLMNILTPYIDNFTRRRLFGGEKI